MATREINEPPVESAADKGSKKKPGKPQMEAEGKHRPTQASLQMDRSQKVTSNRLLHAFFIDPENWEAAMESELRKCPAQQREQFQNWLASSPFSRGPENWKKEDIPAFLKGKIDTPLDELRYRMELFIACSDETAERSVISHCNQKHTLLEFPGVATFIDQTNSTKLAQGKGAKELTAITDWMHLYFRAASIPFRTMKDVLVGDALSGVTIAPEGNMVACATDAARFVLTVRAFFRLHNDIVDYELKKYGHCRAIKINVRSALALSDKSLGKIVLNKNLIQHLSVCDVMNFSARISGVPEEGGIVVSKEAAKHLEPVFILEKIDPADAMQKLLVRDKEELEEYVGKVPESKEKLMEHLELLYRCARLNFLLFDIFERPNIPDSEMKNANGPYITEQRRYVGEFRKVASQAVESGLISDAERIELEGESAHAATMYFSQERFCKRPKFKGYDKEQLENLYLLVDYRTFRSDRIATPETSKFESLFLNRVPPTKRAAMNQGEQHEDDLMPCGLEQFVHNVGSAYGFPTKTNFNPSASAYVMYTMQMTGAPTFAYNVATRATGVMLYALEQIQKDWNTLGVTGDAYLEQLQGKLVQRGVFDEQGNINEDALKDYLAKDVVLPALTAELGLMTMFQDREHFDAFFRTEATARLMGRKIYYVNQEQGEDVADNLINMHIVSKGLLEEVNSYCKERGTDEPIPEETLTVLGRISFQHKNQGIERANGDEHDFAAQAIVLSRVVETDRHRKAFESDEAPQTWISIYNDDIKGTNTVIYPYFADVYKELFLSTIEGKRLNRKIAGISTKDPLRQNE